ncbi:hypothetical protein COCNU_01G002230 [Cocos nucifera]|uniref:Uncharacterized protein n=1 Tax=Cocos nucifera TaxID=13894 RepID=A0A8K0MU64_COCNU|nr:hypothetical protein COCNU_01G002230 [Cocos nucifera]
MTSVLPAAQAKGKEASIGWTRRGGGIKSLRADQERAQVIKRVQGREGFIKGVQPVQPNWPGSQTFRHGMLRTKQFGSGL